MKAFKPLGIVYIYSLAIFIVSVVPVSYDAVEGWHLDKLFHLIVYFTMAVLALCAFRESRHPYVSSFAYAFFFGCFIEVVQYFLPYRSFEVYDIVTNTLGAGMGLFLRVLLSGR